MRVGLIGLGNAGYTLHLPALAGLAAAQVVGAVDPDRERRERAAQKFSVPVFASFDELLERAQPELLVIGTPPDSHATYCRKALAAGMHVLCEKPFASSVAEAEDIIAAARDAGRGLALNHEFREMPIFRALLDVVRRPNAGRVAFAQVWQLIDLPPWAEPGWRGQMLQRTLYEAGVHLVDLLLALFGEKPLAVQAAMSSCGVRESESDAVALVTLEFSGGRLAQVVQNRLCKGETQYFEVRAEMPDSSLRASFGGRARVSAGLFRSSRPSVRVEFGVSGLAWEERHNHRRFLARNPKDPGAAATKSLFERTIQAFQSGGRPPASGEDGRDVLEVIAACYHAGATGRRVLLDSDEARSLRTMRMGAPPA